MLSLLDILHRIDSGALSPSGALRLTRDAIQQEDGAIEAFVTLDPAARAGESGPLRGIAVGVKDIVDTAEMPTEFGSPIYAGWRPRADASLVALLKRAGATVIGKTATTPFAYIDPTTSRNPRNPEHTPGGSSSGSAAAVAAGMVPLAVGTQTGGSVIRPASYCGVAAIKPSFRILPTVGVKTFSWSLDTPGLFAATVADTAYALAALTGRSDLRVVGASPTFRIGVVTQDFAGDADVAMGDALMAASKAVERAGAVVRPLELPRQLADAFQVHPTLQDFEANQALAWEYDHHRSELPPLLGKLLDDAQAITAGAYDSARRTAHRARSVLDAVFAEVDVLLTYAAPGPAPKGLGSTGNARFNRLWTLTGNPCVNVPGLTDASGLPLGMQIVAPFGADARALAAGAFLESALRA
jgi:Asp-tRNA(Asn)/Glu-tRNA(Gln) amidotransferase A subunit family amidase